MSLKICVLASGSKGNCTYLASETTSILIDAGLSRKKIVDRLKLINVDIADIDGICVTHEHSDHISGLDVLVRNHSVPLYGNRGTVEALFQKSRKHHLHWNIFTNGCEFDIGDLQIEAFSVPHDAYDPVGFHITCGDVRVAACTDLGLPTALIRQRLKHCHALILEANHDELLLQESPRPWSLKQRVLGRQGHLSNAQAGEVLREIAHDDLQQVFLAHLSEDCNRGELALAAAHKYLADTPHVPPRVSLTYADQISDFWTYEPRPQTDSVCVQPAEV
ncbi:MAG: phosphoribosyl 1,2-cyclic phosphodiesterase [Kiritimatiellia bacterium]|jgi:phosphoribosyl 1,2-cyclic phosphodiesterase